MVTFAKMSKPLPPRPLLEAQVMELEKFYKLYRKADRFKPGDLLVRVNDANCCAPEFVGEPYIVLEVREDAPLDWTRANPGSPGHGVRMDIRVLTLGESQSYSPVWLESWMFEPYQPKGEQTEGQS